MTWLTRSLVMLTLVTNVGSALAAVKLVDAIKNRDATAILIAYRHGLRASGEPFKRGEVGTGTLKRPGIEQVANRPTLQEMADRLAAMTPVKLAIRPAEILREERDRR